MPKIIENLESKLLEEAKRQKKPVRFFNENMEEIK